MLIYVYDSTFEGLLSAIHEAYYRRETPGRILGRHNLQQNLLDTYVYISTDAEKALKVYTSIRERISSEALENVYYIYLSEFEDAGTWIYEYLKLGWKMGQQVDLHLSDDRVLRLIDLKRKVAFEVHRMTGLLRFKRLEDGIFYSEIGTDYNIVELLAPHFADRMADQNWIIHDIKRGLAAIYDRKEWVLAKVDRDPALLVCEEEESYQDLWKHFFKTIAIKSRTNVRVQKQHMPVRYWKYLTEKM